MTQSAPTAPATPASAEKVKPAAEHGGNQEVGHADAQDSHDAAAAGLSAQLGSAISNQRHVRAPGQSSKRHIEQPHVFIGHAIFLLLLKKVRRDFIIIRAAELAREGPATWPPRR